MSADGVVDRNNSDVASIDAMQLLQQLQLQDTIPKATFIFDEGVGANDPLQVTANILVALRLQGLTKAAEVEANNTKKTRLQQRKDSADDVTGALHHHLKAALNRVAHLEDRCAMQRARIRSLVDNLTDERADGVMLRAQRAKLKAANARLEARNAYLQGEIARLEARSAQLLAAGRCTVLNLKPDAAAFCVPVVPQDACSGGQQVLFC
ncbi:hypothetical protein JKP88DRAFT_283487 [Tribonema minus]|uniref:Uncharacterized protein n=1 Tax=Tribonema minus TaxID=303371 RepID=A0A835YKK0_9STRA|nr:hypothetical protein JKP88DRAFT_283487 [Tribonema minus]